MKKTDKELDELLDRLSSSTHRPKGEFSADNTYHRLRRQMPARSRKLKPYYFSAAAVALLLMAMSWALLFSHTATQMITVQTLAEVKEVVLPDGTQVTLNHHSALTYPETFSEAMRMVSLVGEGYFDVTKNAAQPFLVKAHEVNITVLGTRFNVSAYPLDARIETTLIEGSVSVSNKNTRQSVLLKPNESAVYDKYSFNLSHQNAPRAAEEIAWRDGTLLFNSLTMYEVARKLTNRFGTIIEIPEEALRQYKVTAKFSSDESLDEILELLGNAAHFTYTQQQNKIELTLH